MCQFYIGRTEFPVYFTARALAGSILLKSGYIPVAGSTITGPRQPQTHHIK